ncbi:kelch domain-containing protein 3 [Entomortierella beljakovae]|nr:kelch domain-containing protein 3 [Entomortierella beljakovae]
MRLIRLNIKSFSVTILLSLASNSYIVQSQTTPTPTNFAQPKVVSEAAYARTRNKLYIAGSLAPYNTSQFISLDLTVPWNSSHPAWEILPEGPAQRIFPAAFSADEKTMIAFYCGSPFAMRYDVEKRVWSSSTLVPKYNYEGVGAVTDPTSGLVYLAGGYTGSRDSMTIYDFRWDMFQPISKPLPAQSSNIFKSRAYYGNVYSKKRNSILYFGGYNISLKADRQNNVVTEYIPSTEIWQTLNTKGTPPPMRADHCMTSNEDGSIVVIYGGRIGGSGKFLNDLYILDTGTMTWKMGAPGVIRAYVSCTIAGDQFLAWGGVNEFNIVASSDMLIYSLTNNVWISNYNPPSSYVLHPPTATTVGHTASPISEGSSHAGAIAGGVVGGIALVCIATLIYIFHFRKRMHGKEASLIGPVDSEYDGHSSPEINPNDSVEELRVLRDQVRTQQEELEMQRRLLIVQQQQNQVHHREQSKLIQEQREKDELQRANVMSTDYPYQIQNIPNSTAQQYYHPPPPPLLHRHNTQNSAVTSPTNSIAILSVYDSNYISQ